MEGARAVAECPRWVENGRLAWPRDKFILSQDEASRRLYALAMQENVMRFTVKGIERSGQEHTVTETNSARVARGVARAADSPLERFVICDAKGSEILSAELDRLAESEETSNA